MPSFPDTFFVRLIILRSSGPGQAHKVLYVILAICSQAIQLNERLYPFQGLNVGGVSEGGGAEQKASLQVSLQLPHKSSKVGPSMAPKLRKNKIDKSYKSSQIKGNPIF